MAAIRGGRFRPDVLYAALSARFRSRQDHTFADKILSAMRAGFGGHVEPKARKPDEREIRRAADAGPRILQLRESSGASGDLTHRLLVPSLYNLAASGLPRRGIRARRRGAKGDVERGFPRRSGREPAAIRDAARGRRHCAAAVRTEFAYVAGDADDPRTYKALGAELEKPRSLGRGRRQGNRRLFLSRHAARRLSAPFGSHLRAIGLAAPKAPNGPWRRR